MTLPVASALAEQMQRFGEIEAHYVVIPSSRIQPSIAEQYGIVRSRNRALVNIALRDPNTGPVAAKISGTATNLLSQPSELRFREVREDDSIYYLASLSHTDAETFRFDIAIRIGERNPYHLRFQQTLYVE
jgi:hypothetical protein